jgi:hypothetical protein
MRTLRPNRASASERRHPDTPARSAGSVIASKSARKHAASVVPSERVLPLREKQTTSTLDTFVLPDRVIGDRQKAARLSVCSRLLPRAPPRAIHETSIRTLSA